MDQDVNPYSGRAGYSSVYEEVTRYARERGLAVWANGPQISSVEPVPCETRTSASACGINASLWRPYLELSSFTTLFEMPYKLWVAYNAHKSISGALAWPAAKLGGLVLDTPDAAGVDRAVDLAVARDLGWISVSGRCTSSKTSGCTYAQLPTFWDALVAKIAAVNDLPQVAPPAAGAPAAASPSPLAKLRIDPKGVTISGISSGADFAVQFHVAFSSVIRGVGVFAGQPYHCAVTRFLDDPLVPPNPHIPVPCIGCPPNKTLEYDHCKQHPERVQARLLREYATAQAAAGAIDNTSHLRDARIYLYRGTKDPCYRAGSEGEVINFYRGFNSGLNGEISLEATVPSLHAQPTIHEGSPCGGPYDPSPYSYLANCGYDGAGAALQHIYNHSLRPPVKSASLKYLSRVPQAKYMQGRDVGLASEAYIFVPPRCADGSALCKLHLWFHGCGGPDRFYNASVHYAGFNEWAEANDLVILYPAMRDWGNTTETLNGCWDGYGQTGADYALRSGGQMASVRRMIKDIGGV